MKKFTALVLALIMGILVFGGCEKTEQEVVDISFINVGVLKGYCGVGMAQIIDLKKCNNVAVAETADEIKEMFMNGEVDIAAVPLNLAGKLCNETEEDIRIFAATNLGVMHIMDSANQVKNFSDLKGKTIYASGKGLTSEFILNYILERNDMLDEVTVEYMDSYEELSNAMLSGEITLAMFEQTEAAALKEKAGDSMNINYALDISSEWTNITSSMAVQGCLICKAGFANENEAALKAFINAYGDSVEFVNAEHDKAAAVLADAGIVAGKEAALKSIDGCNAVCVVGTQMLEMARNTVEILYGVDANSMGGSLPSSKMYLTYEE